VDDLLRISEKRLAKGKSYIGVEVLAIATEATMGFNLNHKDNITWEIVRVLLRLSWERNLRSIIHSSLYIRFQRSRHHLNLIPATFRTFDRDSETPPTAFIAVHMHLNIEPKTHVDVL
jgi:hypothetical protein